MVNSIVGSLFSNPEDIKAERQKELQAQMLKAQTPLTGSIDSLLGSVVASGAARGNMLGNQVRGMFGVQSPEEQKAAQVQGMVKSVTDFNDPEQLKQLAQQLNNAGMTKEAVQVLELYRKAVSDKQAQEDRSRKQAKEIGEKRQYPVTVYKSVNIGSAKTPNIVSQPTTAYVVEEWRGEKEGWVVIFDPRKGGAADGSASAYGGITVIDPKTGMATMTEGDPAVDGYQEDLTISP